MIQNSYAFYEICGETEKVTQASNKIILLVEVNEYLRDVNAVQIYPSEWGKI